MNLDGLVLRITYDLLINLQRRGLTPSNLKIKLLSRDKSAPSSTLQYSNTAQFFENWKKILDDKNFLCSAGSFPIIQNLHITNNNLKFDNSYQWYDITGDIYLVKKIKFDSDRSAIYQREIEKYIELMNQLIDQYNKDVNAAITSRSQSYVDPCYVDSGYISITKN